MRSAALTCSTLDRFIPQRGPSSPPSLSPSSSSPSSSSPVAITPTRQLHNAHLASSLLPSPTQRTLTFHSSPPRASPPSPSPSSSASPLLTSHHRSMSHHLSHSSSLHSLYHHPSSTSSPSSSPLASTTLHPSVLRTLDAPLLLDDYYLSLLDWSPSNLIAIALSSSLYLYNPSTSAISTLLTLPSHTPLTSTRFGHCNSGGRSRGAAGAEEVVAVGCDDGTTLVLDVHTGQRLRAWRVHEARVGSLSWGKGAQQGLLSSGGRDGRLVHADVRTKEVVAVWDGAHEEEVCGLEWSPDGRWLASGSNDNDCHLWWGAGVGSSAGHARKWTMKEHTAAVKALAWCPTKPSLLATGGGTSDRHIRLYDTRGVGVEGGEGEGGGPRLVHAVDSRSQVCSLRWHAERPHLLSTHGFSDNAIIVWQHGRRGGGVQLEKMCEMSGHTARVLHSALSPDGTEVCSAGADETLRFWKVWDALPSQGSRGKYTHHRMQSAMSACIR